MLQLIFYHYNIYLVDDNVDNVDEDVHALPSMVSTSPTEEVTNEKLTTIPTGKISKKNKRKKKDFDLEDDDDGTLG